ncbi:MAG: MBL fold metallo-hydrolase [Gammaproteobacteria bacterium AqS3]|nr:MBL fold metallo-hydrolase [Gammaproteobacteria bacterium AqS3]
MARNPDLHYPLQKNIPEPGNLTRVTEGVYWLRMPLPFALNHINLYLLEGKTGWTAVDTGVYTAETRSLWEKIFAQRFDSAPLERVVVTHMHPDHIGLAGWMTRLWGVELWMSRTDFYQCRMLVSDRPGDVPEEAVQFYRRAGYEQRQIDSYCERFGRYGSMIYKLPAGFRRLRDGDELDLGTHRWRIVEGRGHAPEHLCLYCEELQVLISGDQVLPEITSNVSVFPTEPWGNPLGDWLESCRRLPKQISDQVLVLPAHGPPFVGMHRRMQQLIQGHEEGLEKLWNMCREKPRRAVDVFDALFHRKIQDDTLMMATGESLAHLNCLYYQNKMQCEQEEGVNWYQSC